MRASEQISFFPFAIIIAQSNYKFLILILPSYNSYFLTLLNKASLLLPEE